MDQKSKIPNKFEKITWKSNWKQDLRKAILKLRLVRVCQVLFLNYNVVKPIRKPLNNE